MERKSKRIKARLISTGKMVEVDDLPTQIGILRCYNNLHEDLEGNIYSDEELDFLDRRLQ